LFAARCEGCHTARAATDAPLSREPFARWEPLIFSPAGPLVWAAGRYETTGIEPTLHASGTRIPSLRRLERKRPYFTDGSAPTLEAVLAEFRYAEEAAFHRAAADTLRRLDPGEREALAAFLRLL
jgi:cytochrome c peroxidase